MAARAERALPPDALKINYVLMKTTELKVLWKLVQAGEERPLSRRTPSKAPALVGWLEDALCPDEND
jgi:hypothetical protein